MLDSYLRQLAATPGYAESYQHYHSIYRGTARNDRTVKSMLRYLFGDRREEPRSRDYSMLVKRQMARGTTEAEAIARADEEIARRVLRRLKQLGPEGYFTQHQDGTVSGMEHLKKRSTALSFADKPMCGMIYSRINEGYVRAETGDYTGLVHMFVLHIEAKRPLGIWPREVDDNVGQEFAVISHVSARDIRGIFVGFSQRTDPHTPNERWYYLEIESRDRRGIPRQIGFYGVSRRNQFDFAKGTRLARLERGRGLELDPGCPALHDSPELQRLIQQTKTFMSTRGATGRGVGSLRSRRSFE